MSDDADRTQYGADARAHAPGARDEQTGLRSVNLAREYNTEDNDIVGELYGPCLQVSTGYDRAVGFFRANIYRELGEELLDFAIKGGKVRIVCSPEIPEPDENAAREGYALRGKRSDEERTASLSHSLRAMMENPEYQDCLEMLRLLIERGSLDLFIAMRPGGIYHRKIGVFRDNLGDFVTFSGSGNETERAISSIEDWSNDEEFDVFRSWGEAFEAGKARRKADYLIKLFEGGTAKTMIRQLDAVERAILAEVRLRSGLEECRPGARKRSLRSSRRATVKPYYYQQEAIRAWEGAGRVGMLAMATGTGKTVTAMSAIKDMVMEGRPVLVVVPTKVLQDQWYENLTSFFRGVPILLAGGGHDWKSEKSKRMFVTDLKLPRIILATMDTAASRDFLEFLRQAHDPVLVADEAHRLGSPHHRQLLEVPFSARIGLSATPERLFDREGSEALSKAFGMNPVYELPLQGTVQLRSDELRRVPILGHFLSQYYYDFQRVSLTALEQEEWDRITSEIRKTIARDPSLLKEGLLTSGNERLKLLFIQRARIVKGASEKVGVADQIVSEWYPPDGRWLIYCDDERQLEAVTDRLRHSHPLTPVMKYHSRMDDESLQETLEFFHRNPSIVVSIRCLDEGADIPDANGAVILASSTNPRQYIQRRGRVLRRAKGKWLARIFDALVLPRLNEGENDIPHSIVRSELARAYEFARSALNQEVTHRLWEVCTEYGVRLDRDVASSVQEEEMEG